MNRGTSGPSNTIRSGISPLDEHLGGGIATGRIHLLTGGIGTGKTIAAMQFLGAGIERGESALLLTSSKPADVQAHALFAGVSIAPALRAGRLVALRFRPTFATRIAHAATPRAALDDLRHILGSHAPARIAIDSVLPFLGNGSAMGDGLTALAEFLEDLGTTSLLTCPGDLANGTDRRFDGLVERAATVVHLARSGSGTFTLGLLRGYGAGPGGATLPFSIAPRSGITRAPATGQAALGTGERVLTARRLMLLHAPDAASPEIVELLQRDYELLVSPLALVRPGEHAAKGAGAIVIETHHASLDVTRAFVQRAAQSGTAAIIIIVRFNLRSIDRARLLRAGADEVLATDMSPPELLQRLSAAVARGHLDQPLIRYSERSLTQASVTGDLAGPLDHATFAAALADHVAHDHPTQYTVVSLAPSRASRGSEDPERILAMLADVAMRAARIASGDLVACFDGRIVVYLHGARRGDASPFADRVRGAWPARERGSIEIDFFSYPADESRLRTLMEASPQS